jgi:hypothetical protein
MLKRQHESYISEVLWNEDHEELCYSVDCCKYSGLEKAQEGVNWRAGWINNDATEVSTGFANENITQWVRQQVRSAHIKSNELT